MDDNEISSYEEPTGAQARCNVFSTEIAGISCSSFKQPGVRFVREWLSGKQFQNCDVYSVDSV